MARLSIEQRGIAVRLINAGIGQAELRKNVCSCKLFAL